MEGIIVGVIIISLCVGHLHEAVYGWLTFGGCLVLMGIIAMIAGDSK